MNAEERQVIDDIFRRLEEVANQSRDPEAERYIAEKVRRQPYAPYALAQAAYVQEQAVANLSAEVEQLRAEAEERSRQPQQGGFLSGLFGGGRPAEPPRGAVPPAGIPTSATASSTTPRAASRRTTAASTTISAATPGTAGIGCEGGRELCFVSSQSCFVLRKSVCFVLRAS